MSTDITLKSGIKEFGFLLENKEAWLSTLVITDIFGKVHKNVLEKIDNITNKIEAELRQLKSKKISSLTIGKKVLSKLKQTDQIAYLRFLSVFESFENLSDFNKEVKKLKKGGNENGKSINK